MPAMRWGSARTPSGAGRESVAADSESDLFSAAKDGDRRALGRLLSLVESGQPAALRLAASVIPPRSDDGSSSATVFGITGPPGVGKSCLVDHIATAWSEAGRSVSVLCVDPSSSLRTGRLTTNGAINQPFAPSASSVQALSLSKGNSRYTTLLVQSPPQAVAFPFGWRGYRRELPGNLIPTSPDRSGRRGI